MVSITRFDPFDDLVAFEPFQGDFFKGFAQRPIEGEPPIKREVSADGQSCTVKAGMPGVQRSDIQVSVDGNRVSIRAAVKRETEEQEGRQVIRSERCYGGVARTFSPAHHIDEAGARAKYADGMADLRLPKRSGAASRDIAVS